MKIRRYNVRFVPPRPWTADDDRKVVANGWRRWRPEWGDDEIFLNDVRATSELQARAAVMGAFRLVPHDIVISAEA
jgi:hypothetical protein